MQVLLTLDPCLEVRAGVAQLCCLLFQCFVLPHCILVSFTAEVVKVPTGVVPVSHVLLLFRSEEHYT